MTNSIAEALNKAMGNLETEGEIENEAPTEVLDPTPEETTDENAPETPETVEPLQEAVETEEAVESPSEAPDEYATAPSSWKKETSAKWGEIPSDLRAEIHRRESDYHKGIEQYRQAAQVANEMRQTIAPYMENIRAAGVEPLHAITQLLTIENVLRNGKPEEKAAKFSELARDYGIDFRQVAQLPPVDPKIRELTQQNQQLRQYQQSIEQQQSNVILNEIEAFRANPENVHFDAVREDMAVLLKNGRANNLKEAYEAAVWMRPDIRKTLVSQQQTEAQRAAQRKQKAQAASGGVKGSSGSKSSNVGKTTSLRDTLSLAMDGNL